MRAAILGIISFVLACGPSAITQDQPVQSPSRAAESFLAAWKKGDSSAMKALALAKEPDPFLVADYLWLAHVTAARKEKKEASRFLDAARALAEAAQAKKATRTLHSHVARWSKSSPAAQSLAWELGTLQARLSRYRNERMWQELVDADKDAAALITRGVGTLAAVKIRITVAIAWKGLGKPATAAAEYERAAELAEKCDWPRARGDALQWAGSAWNTAGNLPAACRAWKRELDVQVAFDRPGRAARAKMHLGGIYGRMREYDKAFPLLKTAATELAELGDRETEALCFGNLGTLHLARHEVREALESLKRARAILEVAGKDPWQIEGELGTVHWALGDYAKAQECFQRAIEGTPADRPECAAGFRTNLARVHIRAGKYDLAIKQLKKAARTFQAAGSACSLAITYLSLGEVYAFSGRATDALAWYERARDVSASISNSRLRGVALSGLAGVCRRLSRYDDALAYSRQAIRALEDCGDRISLAKTHGAMGNIYLAMTRFDRAISCYMLAMKSIEGLSAPLVRTTTQGALAAVYYRIGRLDDAARLANQALTGYRALGDHAGTGHALKTMGFICEKRGDWDRAEGYLKRSLKYFAESNPRVAARIRGFLGSILLERSRFKEALSESLAALEIATEYGDDFQVGHSSVVAGSAYLMLDRLEEAEAYLRRGLEKLQGIGDGQNASASLATLSRLHRKRREYAKAVACAEDALASIRGLWIGLHDDERIGLRLNSRFASDHGLLAVHESLDTKPEDREFWWRKAFWFCEIGRGMMLAERLVNGRRVLDTHIPAELREQVAVARARTVSALEQSVAATQRDTARPIVARATAALDDRYLAWRQVVAEVRRKAPRVGHLLFPEPIPLERLQQQLPKDSAWIHYQLTHMQALVLVVDRDQVTLRSLGDSGSLEKTIYAYQELARSPDSGAVEAKLATELYARLVKPIEPLLLDKKRLLVSPDETMVFLPIEALIRRDESGNSSRLIERWTVTHAVSATVHDAQLRTVPTPRGHGIVAFGDPDYSVAAANATPDEVTRSGPLSRLVHSAGEVTEIAALFPKEHRLVRLGADASVANFERAFAGRQDRLVAVHIACHGHVDSLRPMLTGLFLAGGQILTLDAIFGLDIPSNLVVLSACNSNVSRVEEGEGTIGLVRGFFFAGCPRVVVSNWAVSDERTSRLMVSFYRNMVRDGLPPSDALRAAKLESMRTEDTSAPYYWAPFVLWGRSD